MHCFDFVFLCSVCSLSPAFPAILTQGELPPTINYDTPDPECDLRIFGEKVKVEKVKGMTMGKKSALK